MSKKVPGSRFHKALLINYPTIEDAERGLSSSLITQSQHDSIVQSNEKCQAPLHNTDLGGLIEIHGSGGGPGYSDWTHGCIAVTNNDMDELYNFSGTGCNMKVTIQQ